MIDSHIHIEKNEYNIDFIKEFVATAVKMGISEIHLLEHSHKFNEFKDVYSTVAQYNEYQKSWLNRRMVASLENYKNFVSQMHKETFEVEVKFGLEVCYVEGTEEIIKNALSDFDWDFVIGAVHWIDGFGFDHKKEHWAGIDVNKAYKRYYDIMKSLIKSDLFDIVAHPDSIKCFGHAAPYDLTETYIEIADLLNKYSMSAEQNSGLYHRYGHSELGMNKKMYDIFKAKNVNIVTSSDAHKPEDVGKYIKELIELA